MVSTPQSVHKYGGYGLRAKNEAEATKLLNDAKLLDEAGVCALVLEKVPQTLATEVSKQIKLPLLELVAGSGTDGQVLVYADAMGMTQGFKPKFLRQFANIRKCMTDGIGDYMKCVKAQTFPNNEESY